MVWMCIVGAPAVATASDLVKLREWFLDICIKAANPVGLKNTAMDVKAHVEKYFYLEAVHKGVVEDVAVRRMQSDGAVFY